MLDPLRLSGGPHILGITAWRWWKVLVLQEHFAALRRNALLGAMLKSMAGGASAAASLLKGMPLQVGMVRRLLAILGSPAKVAELRGGLQKGEAEV
jgi:hypothetical protein